MLRENSDVLEVFVENILNFIYEYRHMNSIQLAEFIVHFMFQDLTAADANQRVIYVIYALTMKSFPGEIDTKIDEGELEEEF